MPSDLAKEFPVYSREFAVRLLSGLKEMPSGCFEWQRFACPYGRIKYKNKMLYVHRAIVELRENRYLAKEEVVMHKCDNSRCANPEHLVIGDVHQNIQDLVLKKRIRQGPRRGRPILTEDQVIKAKLLLKNHSTTTVARILNIGETTARNIKTGKTWKNVELPSKSELLALGTPVR